MTRDEIEKRVWESVKMCREEFPGDSAAVAYDGVMALCGELLPRIEALETYERARGIAAAAIRKSEDNEPRCRDCGKSGLTNSWVHHIGPEYWLCPECARPDTSDIRATLVRIDKEEKAKAEELDCDKCGVKHDADGFNVWLCHDCFHEKREPPSSVPSLPEAVAKARKETDGTPSQPFDGERDFLLALDRERTAVDAAFAEKSALIEDLRQTIGDYDVRAHRDAVEIARLKYVIGGRKTV